MPTILRVGKYRFFFYSDEGAEPSHIHVVAGEKLAKYWPETVELASSKRFRAHELGDVRGLVLKHRDAFLEAWHGHFDTRN